LRVLVRRQEPGQIGSAVGGVAAGVGVTALESPELIPLAVPIGAEAGRRGEIAIREHVFKDPPYTLSEFKFLRDAFIRLEGAIRAAHSCDYEQMIYDLQLAENLYVDRKDTAVFSSTVDSATRAKETQRYLDETLRLRRDVLPKILREECGCRR